MPPKILEKGNDLEPGDKDFVQLSLERGYDIVKAEAPALALSALTQEILALHTFAASRSVSLKETRPEAQFLYHILKVADKFDRLTAMNINQPPISELLAMDYLSSHEEEYDQKVVSALADCIHILPTGACLDFSNGEKGLVLQENPNDFLHPMVLNFSDNQIYDMSNPKVRESLHIVDIMKTMDNRIQIDEETLKHFTSDQATKATLDHFYQKKALLAQRRQQSEK